ncbi:cytokine receptor [Anaeramoeba ignava]|uniref:Cytokine receptor n=1 Tax=Anaeramoeba ignava TaxID=1746090 RepID=A0A9Q0LXV1_ANAIG|nr:cytokine receptor [Anaeramoeba ignava]
MNAFAIFKKKHLIITILIIIIQVTLTTSEGIRTNKHETNKSTEEEKLFAIVGCNRYVATYGSDFGNNCDHDDHPCATISRAVSKASQNDVICVFSGTYYLQNPIYINDKIVTIRSLDSYLTTFIDGGNSHSCVGIYTTDDHYPVSFQGFTFQNCKYADSTNFQGGAINLYCTQNGASHEFQNCMIDDNYGNKGGGIFDKGCDLILDNVEIHDNQAVYAGGGFYCQNQSDYTPKLTITDSKIFSNTLTSGVGSNVYNYESGCEMDNGTNIENCGTCEGDATCNISGICVCFPGSYQYNTTYCIDCQAGYYSSEYNSPTCTPCSENYYSESSAPECIPCPYLTTSSQGASQCTPPAITNFATTNLTSTSIAMFWDASQPFEVDEYQLNFTYINGSNIYNIEPITQYTLSGLLSGIYTMKIRGYNSQGYGPWTSELQIATLTAEMPSPPQLTAINLTSTSWEVIWSEPYNGGQEITTYEISYQYNETYTVVINTTNLTYTATNLLSGEYDVYAKTYTSNFVSNTSTTKAWTNPAEPPSTMDPVFSLGNTSTSIYFGWNPPAYSGGKTLTKYQISLEGKTPTSIIDVSILNLTYNSTNLYSGSYMVSIRAYSDNISLADWSEPTNLSTLPPVEPDQISSFQNQTSTTWIEISWDTPFFGGSALLGYYVQYQICGDSSWGEQNLTASQKSFNLTDIHNGTYCFVVFAFNAVGNATGADISLSTLMPVQPGIIDTIYKVSGTQFSIEIGWIEPEFDGGLPIENYTIYYGLTTVGLSQINTANTTTSYNLTGLVSDSLYYIKIAANTMEYSGAASSFFNFTTNTSSVPSQITNLTKVNATPISIYLCLGCSC